MAIRQGMPVAPVTAFYAALAVLLVLGLAGNVSRLRRKLGIGLGAGGDPRLQQAIRAHANAVETLPLALLLLLLLELNGAPTPVVHALGALLLLSRLAHVEGLLRHGAWISAGRFFGTLGTWFAMLGMAIALFVIVV